MIKIEIAKRVIKVFVKTERTDIRFVSVGREEGSAHKGPQNYNKNE